jgi:hypothetical protein
LVIKDGRLLNGILQSGVQAWLKTLPVKPQLEPFNLGIPYLDAFEHAYGREWHPRWLSWMLLRYAEIVIGYMLSELSLAVSPRLMPEDVAKAQGDPLTFGTLVRLAKRFSGQPKGAFKPDSRAAFFLRLIKDGLRTSDSNLSRVDRLKSYRNDIAHGRKEKDATEIRSEIERFLKLDEWRGRSADWKLTQPHALSPWVAIDPESTDADQEGVTQHTGIFESWRKEGQKKERSYLIPWSGRVFALTRQE